MPGSINGMKLARAVRNRWPLIEIIIVSGQRHPVDSDLASDQRRQVVTGGKAAWSVDDSIRIADDHHQGAALRNILAKPGGLEKAGNPSPAGNWTKRRPNTPGVSIFARRDPCRSKPDLLPAFQKRS